ncbi:hypothetical protein DYB26_002540 [Aphanomyces astaci]|uniref:Uncharacterized protein n=1 Tax=Aphanomyces astaci TaxID=112090 RepID=A0A418FUC4_APHAT|nr:hypothetical protein DYB26_002540 [Aphanomyces astaci]
MDPDEFVGDSQSEDDSFWNEVDQVTQLAMEKVTSTTLTSVSAAVSPTPALDVVAALDGMVAESLPRRFNEGDLVEVENRTWPGINKIGGAARVTRAYDEDGMAVVDVRYFLGGSERAVAIEYVQPSAIFEKKSRQRRSRNFFHDEFADEYLPSRRQLVDTTTLDTITRAPPATDPTIETVDVHTKPAARKVAKKTVATGASTDLTNDTFDRDSSMSDDDDDTPLYRRFHNLGKLVKPSTAPTPATRQDLPTDTHRSHALPDGITSVLESHSVGPSPSAENVGARAPSSPVTIDLWSSDDGDDSRLSPQRRRHHHPHLPRRHKKRKRRHFVGGYDGDNNFIQPEDNAMDLPDDVQQDTGFALAKTTKELKLQYQQHATAFELALQTFESMRSGQIDASSNVRLRRSGECHLVREEDIVDAILRKLEANGKSVVRIPNLGVSAVENLKHDQRKSQVNEYAVWVKGRRESALAVDPTSEDEGSGGSLSSEEEYLPRTIRNIPPSILASSEWNWKGLLRHKRRGSQQHEGTGAPRTKRHSSKHPSKWKLRVYRAPVHPGGHSTATNLRRPQHKQPPVLNSPPPTPALGTHDLDPAVSSILQHTSDVIPSGWQPSQDELALLKTVLVVPDAQSSLNLPPWYHSPLPLIIEVATLERMSQKCTALMSELYRLHTSLEPINLDEIRWLLDSLPRIHTLLATSPSYYFYFERTESSSTVFLHTMCTLYRHALDMDPAGMLDRTLLFLIEYHMHFTPVGKEARSVLSLWQCVLSHQPDLWSTLCFQHLAQNPTVKALAKSVYPHATTGPEIDMLVRETIWDVVVWLSPMPDKTLASNWMLVGGLLSGSDALPFSHTFRPSITSDALVEMYRQRILQRMLVLSAAWAPSHGTAYRRSYMVLMLMSTHVHHIVLVSMVLATIMTDELKSFKRDLTFYTNEILRAAAPGNPTTAMHALWIIMTAMKAHLPLMPSLLSACNDLLVQMTKQSSPQESVDAIEFALHCLLQVAKHLAQTAVDSTSLRPLAECVQGILNTGFDHVLQLCFKKVLPRSVLSMATSILVCLCPHTPMTPPPPSPSTEFDEFDDPEEMALLASLDAVNSSTSGIVVTLNYRHVLAECADAVVKLLRVSLQRLALQEFASTAVLTAVGVLLAHATTFQWDILQASSTGPTVFVFARVLATAISNGPTHYMEHFLATHNKPDVALVQVWLLTLMDPCPTYWNAWAGRFSSCSQPATSLLHVLTGCTATLTSKSSSFGMQYDQRTSAFRRFCTNVLDRYNSAGGDHANTLRSIVLDLHHGVLASWVDACSASLQSLCKHTSPDWTYLEALFADSGDYRQHEKQWVASPSVKSNATLATIQYCHVVYAYLSSVFSVWGGLARGTHLIFATFLQEFFPCAAYAQHDHAAAHLFASTLLFRTKPTAKSNWFGSKLDKPWVSAVETLRSFFSISVAPSLLTWVATWVERCLEANKTADDPTMEAMVQLVVLRSLKLWSLLEPEKGIPVRLEHEHEFMRIQQRLTDQCSFTFRTLPSRAGPSGLNVFRAKGDVLATVKRFVRVAQASGDSTVRRLVSSD